MTQEVEIGKYNLNRAKCYFYMGGKKKEGFSMGLGQKMLFKQAGINLHYFYKVWNKSALNILKNIYFYINCHWFHIKSFK